MDLPENSTVLLQKRITTRQLIICFMDQIAYHKGVEFERICRFIRQRPPLGGRLPNIVHWRLVAERSKPLFIDLVNKGYVKTSNNAFVMASTVAEEYYDSSDFAGITLNGLTLEGSLFLDDLKAKERNEGLKGKVEKGTYSVVWMLVGACIPRLIDLLF